MSRLRLMLFMGMLAAGAGGLAAPPGLVPAKRPAHARLYFITPADGATVPRTFTVRFGLSGMGVAPAGVRHANTGHHHLLVDVRVLPAPGQPIASDRNHRHFGGGQTETVLTLPPGTHTLQLELADYRHLPFDPPLHSRQITVHVK